MDATKDWAVSQYIWIEVSKIGNRNLQLKPITGLRYFQSIFTFNHMATRIF